MENHWLDPAERKVSQAAPVRCSFSAIINNKTSQFMKKSLHVLGMIGKYYLYGFVVQLFFLNLMHAAPTKGQSSLDLKEVYLSLDLQGVTLSESFGVIKNKTEFSFIYDQQLIENSLPVNLQIENQSLESVLLSLAASHKLSFKQVDNRISVKIAKRNILEKALVVEVTVSGTVVDSNGEPIPGVTVSVQGTTIGTATDLDGKYSLLVPEGSTLVFSFIGFVSQSIEVGDQSVIDVTLSEDMASLDEVVVVGYGVQRKSDITGAISSISEKALREVPVTNASQMLQGRAPGVYVLNAGNKPGSGMTVQIRGRRSFNAGNDPLYVIDGIPISGGLNDINPGDIESIDILKDASATAIYGSRGANGVIIITTKRGKPGRTTVSYDAYFGVSTIMRYADVMNGPQFAEYKRESRRSVINPATGRPTYDDNDPQADAKLFEAVELESIAEGRTTDYQRMMIRKGHTQSHEISVLGGSENTRFNISLGYFNDEGIIKGQNFIRYTTRFNIDQTIGKRFKVGMSTLGSYSERNGEDENPYSYALRENPLGVPYDENGNLKFLPTNDGLNTNPLSELVPGAVINKGSRFRLLTNLFGEAQLADGLKFRINFGPDLIQNKKDNFYGKYTRARRLGDPSASKQEDFSLSYTLENILTYKKQLTEKHGLDFTGLYGIQTRQIENSSISVLGVPVESLGYYNLGAASVINSVGSGYEKWTILSYMARINYNFADRFLLTLTGRADGSSKFANGNKWGYFPSAAVAWNIDNESFMSNNNFFSDLRLRLSYGKTGNEGIAPYQTKSLLARSQYDFNGVSAFGYYPGSIPNNDLKWESTATLNAGVDFGILHGRMSGSVEVYQSKTTDLLLPFLLPISGGFTSILSNVGSKLNRGIEFSISNSNITTIQKGGFEWSTDLNISHNHEEILELSGGKVDDIGNKRFIGQPAVVYFDFVKEGIWQLGEETETLQMGSQVGQIKIKDVNGNGRIDPDDRQILGSDVPKLIGGMTNRFQFRGFDLSIFVFARLGSMIMSPVHRGTLTQLQGRYQSFDLDYWTENNPTNAYPQPRNDMERPVYFETLQYFDGSFLKIRNINLGYNFSSDISQRLKAQSLRVYVSAQNPFVFSSYTSKHNGIDPEVDNTPNIDTPPSRLLLVGINVKF